MKINAFLWIAVVAVLATGCLTAKKEESSVDSTTVAPVVTPVGTVVIGQPAPEITGPDTDGSVFNLSDFRGKVIVVEFWGDWCQPCKAMYPHQRSIVRNLADKPFAMIGVNDDSSVQIPQRLASNGTVTWRSFQNGPKENSISKALGVKTYPTNFLIDAKGHVRYYNVRGDQLDNAIETLLQEIGEDYPSAAIREGITKEKSKLPFGEQGWNDSKLDRRKNKNLSPK